MKANCMLDVENFYINKLNITTNFLLYLCFFFLFLITGKLTCKKKGGWEVEANNRQQKK